MADRQPPASKGSYPKDVAEAARKANDLHDDFVDATAGESKRGSSIMGSAMRAEDARSDLKRKLPGGTDRLIDLTQDNVRKGVGVPSYKRGGTMKRAGIARLHRGEKIASRSVKGRR